jgi:predicted ATPase
MENHITKIKKVEIKGLWNRFDLSWTLNPDVNVLSGINGSGKSTILNGIVQTLTGAMGNYHTLVDKIIVSFNDGNDFKFLTMKKNLTKKELTEFLTKLKITPDDNADLSKNKATLFY